MMISEKPKSYANNLVLTNKNNNKFMKKILPLSLFILLAVAALNGCTLFSDKPAQDATSQTVNADTVLDNQIFATATAGTDIAGCDEIKDAAKKDECKATVQALLTTQKAAEALDKSLCGSINLDRYKENCVNTVEKRIEAKNLSKKNEEEAQKLNAQRLDIGAKALESGNADECNEIADKNQQYSCKYNVLANQAMQKNDPSLCDKIGDESFIKLCKQSVVKP